MRAMLAQCLPRAAGQGALCMGMVGRRWEAPLAGALTGALLFVADHPVHAWALELVAFVPLLWALSRASSARWAAAAGAAAGLTYTGALAIVLEFPVLM